jgi:hypothetical protein
MTGSRFSLGDLFDRAGRLRPFNELPPEVQAEIASFDIIRVTTRRKGETVSTEELIRVKTRDRWTAEIARRGGDTATRTSLRRKPLRPGLVKTLERSAGAGATAAARSQRSDDDAT